MVCSTEVQHGVCSLEYGVWSAQRGVCSVCSVWYGCGTLKRSAPGGGSSGDSALKIASLWLQFGLEVRRVGSRLV
jgi:hypothetical protein